MSGNVSEADKQQLEKLRLAYVDAQKTNTNVDQAREAYQDLAVKLLIGLSGKLDVTPGPGPEPDEGYQKPGGWGSTEANDPTGWKAVAMKDDPTKFKVVDSKGVNIATEFRSQASAQAWIDKHKATPPQPPVPPTTGKIINKGGRVIQNGKVQFIYCGNWGGASPSIADIDGKFKALFTDGTYFSKLGQYGGVQKPTLLGSIQSTVALPNPFNDPDIVKVIDDAIKTGKVPDFKPNGDMIYVVMPPKGTKSTDKEGDAYHTDFALGGSDKGVLATYYGVYDVDSITIALSEEIIEGLTNAGPGKDAWVADNGDEIGDVCDKASTIAGVKVEMYWSNADGKCVDGSGGGVVVQPPQPPVPPGTTPAAGTDQFGVVKIYPDKAGGQTNTTFKGREMERHYNSGKPSEDSYEYTANASSPDHNSDVEATFYEKINGFKSAPDTISDKCTGPEHQDGAKSWVIAQFRTDGSTADTYETESPHPSYQKINPKPATSIGGSIVGKWFGHKAITYIKDGARWVETWIHFPVDNIDNIAASQSEWRQYVKPMKVGSGFTQARGTLTTSRLDGINKGSVPDFKYCSVREITPPA